MLAIAGKFPVCHEMFSSLEFKISGWLRWSAWKRRYSRGLIVFHKLIWTTSQGHTNCNLGRMPYLTTADGQDIGQSTGLIYELLFLQSLMIMNLLCRYILLYCGWEWPVRIKYRRGRSNPGSKLRDWQIHEQCFDCISPVRPFLSLSRKCARLFHSYLFMNYMPPGVTF